MGFVSKDMIKRARECSVLDYVLAHESNLYKKVGNGYRHKEHPSLAVSEKGFYWHSNGEINGKTALDYLTYVHGYGLVDAVCMLLGEQPYERGDKPSEVIKPKARPPTSSAKDISPSEKIPFAAPIRNKDNRRVIAYLQSRGIDRDLIIDCINQGSLYESLPYHMPCLREKTRTAKRDSPHYAEQRQVSSAMRTAQIKNTGSYCRPKIRTLVLPLFLKRRLTAFLIRLCASKAISNLSTAGGSRSAARVLSRWSIFLRIIKI
jgi:hypothetical protein